LFCARDSGDVTQAKTAMTAILLICIELGIPLTHPTTRSCGGRTHAAQPALLGGAAGESKGHPNVVVSFHQQAAPELRFGYQPVYKIELDLAQMLLPYHPAQNLAAGSDAQLCGMLDRVLFAGGKDDRGADKPSAAYGRNPKKSVPRERIKPAICLICWTLHRGSDEQLKLFLLSG
jgi:hypothetical protein